MGEQVGDDGFPEVDVVWVAPAGMYAPAAVPVDGFNFIKVENLLSGTFQDAGIDLHVPFSGGFDHFFKEVPAFELESGRGGADAEPGILEELLMVFDPYLWDPLAEIFGGFTVVIGQDAEGFSSQVIGMEGMAIGIDGVHGGGALDEVEGFLDALIEHGMGTHLDTYIRIFLGWF